MTKDVFLEKIKAMPEIIENSISMNEPNSLIEIFTGNLFLKIDEFEINIEGKITFVWLPNLGAQFTGINTELNIHDIPLEKTYSIITNGIEFGKGKITQASHSSRTNELTLSGRFLEIAVWGDKSINVSKVRFSIPNLKEFFGTAIKNKEQAFTMGRIEFKNANFDIVIDKSYHYKKRFELLKQKGGFITLYSGELRPIKGSLSFLESTEILDCFNTFLAFLNGRRTSTLFVKGIFQEDEVWCDYTNYFNDVYKDVHSWTNCDSIDGLEQLWQAFHKLWQDQDDRIFLNSIVHWYVEANGHSGLTEGSIIMAQTALELIYNWWIIENIGMILGKDADGISASNKIRLLLSQLNISNKVPQSLTYLQEFIEMNDVIDGPEAIVQIRNAIVHSQVDKRKKLSSIDKLAKYQALQLSIWYLEMSLLKILNYNHKYTNRCADCLEEEVPWLFEKAYP